MDFSRDDQSNIKAFSVQGSDSDKEAAVKQREKSESSDRKQREKSESSTKQKAKSDSSSEDEKRHLSPFRKHGEGGQDPFLKELQNPAIERVRDFIADSQKTHKLLRQKKTVQLG